jgi:hypothetical protein
LSFVLVEVEDANDEEEPLQRLDPEDGGDEGDEDEWWFCPYVGC